MTWPPVPQPPCDPDCSCYEPDPVPPYTPIPRQTTCTSPCCAPPEATARWIAGQQKTRPLNREPGGVSTQPTTMEAAE